MKPRNKWQPLQRANFTKTKHDLLAADLVRLGIPPDQVEAGLEEAAKAVVYVNDTYQVAVHEHGDFVQLSIRRRDGGPILRDWRHFQRIKNELVGEENEGVELYPAESRLVDTSNKFSIFVAKDPSWRFPFGWTHRDVSYVSGTMPGTRQRTL